MISFTKAQETAFRELSRLAKIRRADGTRIGEFGFSRENQDHWIFAASLPDLQAEGWAPGAILVSIRKSDGQIVNDDVENLEV
ncbi:MAG: hypothetical protein KF855_03760 [Acidobacteria bacterium]|nr:hypothetical protein [Acidobacteriota bacterium]